MVDSCRVNWLLVNIVSGVPQGNVLGPLLFHLYTTELFSILDNKLICYADDSTLIAVVPSPGIRVTVAESQNRDLVMVRKWCDLWGMKLNASKTMIDSSSCPIPQSLVLTIGVITITKSPQSL